MEKAKELSTRRTRWTYIKVLLWKNMVLKRRNIFRTLFEIAMPCMFILLMGWLKTLDTDVDVPAGWSDTNTFSSENDETGTSYSLLDPFGTTVKSIPTSLPRYYQHETTISGILLGMGVMSFQAGLRLDELSQDNLATCQQGIVQLGAVSTNKSSEHRIPDACKGKVAPYKIAIAPDNDFTRKYFMQTMNNWYPRVTLIDSEQGNGTTGLEIPSFEESVMFFKSNEEINTYVGSDDYGLGPENPRVHSALIFDRYPDVGKIGEFVDIEYTLRLNSTLGRRGVMGMIPRTIGEPPPLTPFSRSISTEAYTNYALTGFMTLQTLVTRFAACMPVWDSETKSSNGTCQNPQTTAVESPEVQGRLLSQLEDDVFIKLAIGKTMQGGNEGADDMPFVGAGSNITDVQENTDGSSVDPNAISIPGNIPQGQSVSLAQIIPKDEISKLLKPLRQAPQGYLGASVSPFPIEAYKSSPFYDSVKDFFPLIFILANLFLLARVLVDLLQEKENRVREFMKILGVKQQSIITSWYITYGVIIFVSSVLQTLSARAGLFANSSILLIFLFFYCFGLSVLAFGYLMSTIFNRSRVGTIVGLMTFFAMYFFTAGFKPDSTASAKAIGSLLSPVALFFGVGVLGQLESGGLGVTSSNINVEVSNYCFRDTLQFFIIDTILYTLIGLYLERVLPREFGTSLKWYYPVSPSYWRSRKSKGKVIRNNEDPNVALDVNPDFEPVNSDLREQESTGEALVVQGIKRVFSVPGGVKVAVKGMHLTMYKDQITCLLGHNGAGKTTLISMLTGMLAPSSGDATFQGLSFVEDMEEIRESLGICFQHDVLFKDLTVEEHLQLFGMVKGYSAEQLDEIVSKQIREVGLTEKRRMKSCELSGGMKRKLSVAISLLGDSSLVFLDEPTSGMDPYSRRSTWEILLNNRTNRVMVLTTHFMDEADILGDRIAIMAEGELRCCGSSLFLKNRYGAGYNLTVVKDDAVCDDSTVINFISSYVEKAQILSNVGSEIAFQLPIDDSPKFSALFADLDEQMESLGLLTYGVSVTTLEEVFIKVAEVGDIDQQHTLTSLAKHNGGKKEVTSPVPLLSDDASEPMSANSAITDKHYGSLYFVHLKALLLKRFRISSRDKKMLLYGTVYPVLALFLGLWLLSSSDLTVDDPVLRVSTSDFPLQEQTPTPFYCSADKEKWCGDLMSSKFYTGATTDRIDDSKIPSPPFDTNTPTVFGKEYTDTPINQSDPEAYMLRLGEEVYNRGFGKNGEELIEDQYGAYLVHGDSDNNVLGYNIMVNTTSLHAAIIFKALVDQALYRFFAFAAEGSSAESLFLRVNDEPLPMTASTKALFGTFLAFSAVIFILLAFTFFPMAIVGFLVKEKQPEHNSKHQQLVSGVSLSAFWTANYIWDFILYTVPYVAALVFIQVFDIESFTGNGCSTCSSGIFAAVALLFFLFGLAIIPFTYCLSYLFSDSSTSQTYTLIINFILGIVLLITSFVLDVVDSTKSTNEYLIFIWRLSPLFNLGNGLLQVAIRQIYAILQSTGTIPGPFDSEMMGWELLYLAISAVLFSLIALGIDYSMTFPSLKMLFSGKHDIEVEDYEVDSDVIKEADRVRNGGADNDVVKLNGLRKIYKGGKIAVRNLSFGLKRGECFGFLGINGAGKTTTMKMLTGDVVPSRGNASLGGFDIMTQQIEVRRQIGYCPQFDALYEVLTVREHLELFARIKGVTSANLDNVVQEKIEQLNLSDFENKLAGSLSGGNKRKLSVAIALIGNPPIVFLDEPSTGMDPVSRRFMWDVIAGISTRGKASTIVLTTHSMEEAEALCSRVGIMVGGRLRCLGSVQHLKGRYGDGLMLDVKLQSQNVEELREITKRHFDGDETTRITSDQIAAKCEALGHANFAESIALTHPTGYSLASTFNRDGSARAEAFCAWVMDEIRFEALEHFLHKELGQGNVMIMERQQDFARFKLRGSNSELKLSKVFALIENSKDNLFIREYSVSQTTLEQIFNSFASQQTEETGVARGMFRESSQVAVP